MSPSGKEKKKVNYTSNSNCTVPVPLMTNKIKNKHMESPNQLIKAREKDSIIYLGLAKTVET